MNSLIVQAEAEYGTTLVAIKDGERLRESLQGVAQRTTDIRKDISDVE